MAEANVSDAHQSLIVQFLKFHRKRRHEFLQEVDHIFDENKDSQVQEATFTRDEVCTILDQTRDVVRGDLENELMHTCHSMAVLIRMLVAQAEQWHLTLEANVGELDSKHKVAQIAKFERQIERGEHVALPAIHKLAPVADTAGPSALLHKEISKLRQEIDACKHRLEQSEKKSVNTMKHNMALSAAYQTIKDRVNELEPGLQEKITELAMRNEDIGKLTNCLATARDDATEAAALGAETTDQVREELTKLKHEYLAKQAEMAELSKDLDKKISNTSQYQNMKKMLAKKNEMIKALRKEVKQKEQPPVE